MDLRIEQIFTILPDGKETIGYFDAINTTSDDDQWFIAPKTTNKIWRRSYNLRLLASVIAASVLIFLLFQCVLQLEEKQNLKFLSRKLAEQEAVCQRGKKTRKSSSRRGENVGERQQLPSTSNTQSTNTSLESTEALETAENTTSEGGSQPAETPVVTENEEKPQTQTPENPSPNNANSGVSTSEQQHKEKEENDNEGIPWFFAPRGQEKGWGYWIKKQKGETQQPTPTPTESDQSTSNSGVSSKYSEYVQVGSMLQSEDQASPLSSTASNVLTDMKTNSTEDKQQPHLSVLDLAAGGTRNKEYDETPGSSMLEKSLESALLDSSTTERRDDGEKQDTDKLPQESVKPKTPTYTVKQREQDKLPVVFTLPVTPESSEGTSSGSLLTKIKKAVASVGETVGATSQDLLATTSSCVYPFPLIDDQKAKDELNDVLHFVESLRTEGRSGRYKNIEINFEGVNFKFAFWQRAASPGWPNDNILQALAVNMENFIVDVVALFKSGDCKSSVERIMKYHTENGGVLKGSLIVRFVAKRISRR